MPTQLLPHVARGISRVPQRGSFPRFLKTLVFQIPPEFRCLGCVFWGQKIPPRLGVWKPLGKQPTCTLNASFEKKTAHLPTSAQQDLEGTDHWNLLSR